MSIRFRPKKLGGNLDSGPSRPRKSGPGVAWTMAIGIVVLVAGFVMLRTLCG